MNNKKFKSHKYNLENAVRHKDLIEFAIRTPCCGKYLGKNVQVDNLQTLLDGFECPHCQAKLKMGFLITKEGVHTYADEVEYENKQQVLEILKGTVDDYMTSIDNGMDLDKAGGLLKKTLTRLLKKSKIIEGE